MMDSIKMNAEEIQQVIILAGLINLPEKQPVGCEIVGCKGCEGGCASAICAN